MKNLLTLCVTLLSLTCLTAQNSIETQSITLDNLITFIANYFPKGLEINEASINANNQEATKTKQISFILETTINNYATEDKIMLQQAFKFLSSRLTKNDKLSIFVYAGQNGLLLDRVLATETKKILSVLSNVKSSIKTKHTDGIAMAYKQAQEHDMETAENIVIMVRNPNAAKAKTEIPELKEATAEKKIKEKKGNNLVLLTAITLLPEIISIIKN